MNFKERFQCLCGGYITGNVFLQHINSKACVLGDIEKDRIRDILSIKRKNRYAWFVELGKNAKKDHRWYISVIKGESFLKDWSFVCPRAHGEQTPESILIMKEKRVGTNNPVCKSKIENIQYSKEDVQKYANEVFNKLNANSEPIGLMYKKINEKFKDFSCLYADLTTESSKRGHNKQNTIISHLLNIEINELLNILNKRRGLFIQKGQLGSENFKNIASNHASTLCSTWKVTKPHIKLHKMIMFFDERASMEFKLKNSCGRFFSYDIFSPKINSLIEMHGVVWHDPSKTNPGLFDRCNKNVIKDALKKETAILLGYDYIVFWDDEQDVWQKQIEVLYGKGD